MQRGKRGCQKCFEIFGGHGGREGNLIDDAFQAGAALFLTATHLTVARTLFRNCEQYAGAIEASDGSDHEFKNGKTVRELKTMLCWHFDTKAPQASPSKMSKKKQLFKLLLSDSEQDSESESEETQTSELIDVSEKGKGTKRKKSSGCPPPANPPPPKKKEIV